jgi:hypothetical protein
MKIEVSKEEIELLLKIVSTVYDWSGMTEDTPDDYEVLSVYSTGGTLNTVSLGDLKDASATLTKFKNIVDI